MEHTFPIPRSSALKGVVQWFWQVSRNNGDIHEETILPKGMVEVIFDLRRSTAIHAQLGTGACRLPRCFVNGYNSRPVRFRLPEEQTFFGVVFDPVAIKRMFNITARDFADRCIDMALVDASFDPLWHRLAELETFNERVAVLSDRLKERLPHMTGQERSLNSFLGSRTDGIMSVPELARWLCCSPRHLSRKMYEITGMNTERTLLYKRYLQGMHLIHHRPELSLTEIAHACQFADQSHFTKTFKSFTRLAPSRYRSMKSPLFGHLYGSVR